MKSMKQTSSTKPTSPITPPTKLQLTFAPLEAYLKSHNITKAEFAKLLGIKAWDLSHLLSRPNPCIRKLLKVVEATGREVRIEDLIEEVPINIE